MNKDMTTEEKLAAYDSLKVYLKIPITTRYSGDLSYFREPHVVENDELYEKDNYGNDVRCWYVSTTFGDCDDKEWLINEIAECGCVPTLSEKRKGLFI